MKHAREVPSLGACLLGSAIAGVGVVQAQPAIALGGIGLSVLAGAAGTLMRAHRSRTESFPTHIEGLNLDSLELANRRRRLNRSLRVERAFQVAIVEGSDLHLAWQYDGSCRSDHETGIEFSIDSENNIPFERLDCFAFDIQNDPQRLEQIRPSLIGTDGISKKINVPFSKPLKKNDRFSVLLNCTLSGCVSTGLQYYTSSLSFDQSSVENASVHLIFVRTRPEWVRAYDIRSNGEAILLNELRPIRDDGLTCEYIDIARNVPGQSVRVYLYELRALGSARAA